MQEIALFREIAADPFEYGRKLKQEQGRRVVGNFCSYVPEEIIHAAGAVPFRIFGSGRSVARADEHLQAYSCSFGRSVLADGLAGRLDFLDGTVFAHTCDTMQRLSDIWRLNLKTGFHIDIDLPVKLDTAGARDYVIRIFKKFAEQLAACLGAPVASDALAQSVGLYNRLRGDMQRLFVLRRENPQQLPIADLQAIMRAAMIMEREIFCEKLTAVLGGLAADAQNLQRKRLVLAGSICNVPAVHGLIEDCGAAIVWDDSCSGSRYFEGRIDPDGDIIAAIAERYIEKIECPAKHAGLYRRGEALVQIAKDCRADGVIFLLLKFCDPHAFDYPYMKELLQREGIANMVLEIEAPLPSAEQLKTRCQAFLETL